MQSTKNQKLQIDCLRISDPPIHAHAGVSQQSIVREPSEVRHTSGVSLEPPSSRTHSRHPMTPQQAADFLGLDDKTITRWARKGYLPAHAMGEGKKKYWRFFEDELIAWLLEQPTMAEAA